MTFAGVSRVFSTRNNMQYHTIGAFGDEMSEKHGIENLRGLGYNWTKDSIEYVIGLKDGVVQNTNCEIELPDTGWISVKGKTSQLSEIYCEIYKDGNLTYEIETFTKDGYCEILFIRSNG